MNKPAEHLPRKGDTWNESAVAPDPGTGRPVRRLTAAGYNEKPTYHTNTAFTADGEFLVFASGRDGQSAVLKAHLASGELTQLTDPVQGLGGRWELHKCGPSRFCDGQGINGTTLCVAPRTRQALFFHGRSLRAVHLDTLAERTLVADIGEEWIEGVISIDPAETHALVALMPAHPRGAAGASATLDDYFSCFSSGGISMTTRHLQVPLDDGPTEVIFEDRGVGCAHCPHCPTDGNLVLIDRDLPPKFWCGDYGKTNRCWILNVQTKALTPIVPHNAQRFQVHACWTFDGLHVFYHGWRTEGGWYVGVADRQGQIVREYDFPEAVGYGHVSADPRRQAIILDGNVTKDMLMWLYWDSETPRLEPICRHATEWDSLSGQLHDPHPAADPTGRWIAYNAAHGGRSDVYAVEVEE
jgi:hypothetical protein